MRRSAKAERSHLADDLTGDGGDDTIKRRGDARAVALGNYLFDHYGHDVPTFALEASLKATNLPTPEYQERVRTKAVAEVALEALTDEVQALLDTMSRTPHTGSMFLHQTNLTGLLRSRRAASDVGGEAP